MTDGQKDRGTDRGTEGRTQINIPPFSSKSGGQKECKARHDEVTKTIREMAEAMEIKERAMTEHIDNTECKMETGKKELEEEVAGVHWELTRVKEKINEVIKRNK